MNAYFNDGIADQPIREALKLRAENLNLRILGAVVAAIVSVPLFPGQITSFIWFLGFACAHVCEALFFFHNENQGTAGKGRTIVSLLAHLASTTAFVVLTLLLWKSPILAAKLAASIYFCTGLIYVLMLSYRCSTIFWTAMIPYAVTALLLLGYGATRGKLANPIEVASLLGMFIVLFSSVLSARANARQLYANVLHERQTALEASKAKSSFLATMSHELRTPMNGILGCAELLKRRARTAEDTEIIETLIGAGNTLLELLNDLLDVSKVEAGKMSVEKIPFDPRALGQELADLWQPQIVRKGLRFDLVFSADLPAALTGDPSKLKQVLHNLLSNAAKFTEQGKVTLAVSFNSNDGLCGELVCHVQDTGIGMGQVELARIFKPFEQADQTISRRFGGSGLGTAISLSLSKLMGGDLTVVSQPGIGSMFKLSVPAEVTILSAPSAAPIVQIVPQDRPNTDEVLRILVAEDNAMNRLVLQKFLEIGNHEVVYCENGQEALEVSSRQKFDLVILDVRMPVMDGFTALTALRASAGLNADIPIVMLSADAMPEDQVRGLALGADAYLTKPIKPTQLFQALAVASYGRDGFADLELAA